LSKEEDEESYGMEVLNLKDGAGGGVRGRRTLRHGSPTSKEELVSKEGEEELYGMEVLPQRRSR
jgi:hypothetical protein